MSGIDREDIGSSKDPTTTGGPVETKVAAASGGAGVGAVLGGLVVYLLDQFVYTPGSDQGDHVPLVVMTAVTVLLGAAGAFLAGYRAPHTARADEDGAGLVGPMGEVGPMGPMGPRGPVGPPGRDAPGAVDYLGAPQGDPVAGDNPERPGGLL